MSDTENLIHITKERNVKKNVYKENTHITHIYISTVYCYSRLPLSLPRHCSCPGWARQEPLEPRSPEAVDASEIRRENHLGSIKTL